MQYGTALDVESIRLPNGISAPFAIVTRKFGRDPHEYIGDRRKGTLVHSPLHKFEPKIYIIKEFFEHEEICAYVKKSEAWSRKLLDFFMSVPPTCKKAPLKEILEEMCDRLGPIMAHCIDADLDSIWNGDRLFKTGIFPNGPFHKSPVLKNWNELNFVCTKKAFTCPSLNEKFLKKYPDLIDLSLEALTIAIRGGSLNFHQNHRPQDDVDLLIDLLDHVYTHVSKKEFWNLLQLKHDYYDSKPVHVHMPGSIRFDTIQAFDQSTSKN